MKEKGCVSRILITITVLLLAVLFILPSVLTLTNSFMEKGELSAHYGSVFEALVSDDGFYANSAQLQMIPDTVSVSQYSTVLFHSPDYLYKFWNSVALVFPIVLGQVAMAAMAAYAFYRRKGTFMQIIFSFTSF